MQLEDRDEHTPDQLPDALVKISELAQQLLATGFHTSELSNPRYECCALFAPVHFPQRNDERRFGLLLFEGEETVPCNESTQ